MSGKGALGVLAALAVLGGIGWAVSRGYRANSKEKEGEDKPVETPSRVASQDGESVVTLDSGLQERMGLKVALLAPVSRREEVRAYGTVLDVSELADLRARRAALLGERDKARAQAEASEKEKSRLAGLAGTGGGVSARALEAAQAAAKIDHASLEAAEAALRSAEEGARLRWGDAVLQSDRLLSRQDVLIQAGLPPGAEASTFPAEALVEARHGAPVTAALVSPATRADPRLQGPAAFYRAPASGFLPGMNVPVRLPTGDPVAGTVVPPQALVWWQGRAWVYVRKDGARFTRREVATDRALPDGWFVKEGLAPGENVVVSGAQQILSEEFRSQIKED